MSLDLAHRGGAPRFSPGDRVRVDARPVAGHCRTPFYLRGQVGEVVAVEGPYRDPEKLAYHLPGLPTRYLYRVAFRQREIWPHYPGSDADTLAADIYEHWLSPAIRGDGET